MTDLAPSEAILTLLAAIRAQIIDSRMTDLAPSEAILTLLAAIRAQIDVVTALSSGGFGVIILTWSRILGIFDNASRYSFRKPAFLILPGSFLLLAIIVGYLAGSLTTGYHVEIANGVDSSSKEKIADARKYYFDSYHITFHWWMLVQLCLSTAGIVLMAGWFTWNIINPKGDPNQTADPTTGL